MPRHLSLSIGLTVGMVSCAGETGPKAGGSSFAVVCVEADGGEVVCHEVDSLPHDGEEVDVDGDGNHDEIVCVDHYSDQASDHEDQGDHGDDAAPSDHPAEGDGDHDGDGVGDHSDCDLVLHDGLAHDGESGTDQDGAGHDGEADAAHDGETDAAHDGETDAAHDGDQTHD